MSRSRAPSLFTIATFWLATLVAELFLSVAAITWVKQAIVWGLFVLIPLLMITGGSGFAMGRNSTYPVIVRKRRRMPFIALNGMLILAPAAIHLSWKAQAGHSMAGSTVCRCWNGLPGPPTCF